MLESVAPTPSAPASENALEQGAKKSGTSPEREPIVRQFIHTSDVMQLFDCGLTKAVQYVDDAAPEHEQKRPRIGLTRGVTISEFCRYYRLDENAIRRSLPERAAQIKSIKR